MAPITGAIWGMCFPPAPSLPFPSCLLANKDNVRSRKTTDAEIFTLRIVNRKFYIVNTQRLLPVIQRSAKVLSLRPFGQIASKTHADCTDDTFHKLGTSVGEDLGQAFRRALAPGPYLDDQNLRTGQRALVDVQSLVSGEEVWLLEWVKHTIVQASSCGLFGAQHPFLDPNVEKAFW